MTTTFEDRLLRELRGVVTAHGEAPAAAPRRLRRLRPSRLALVGIAAASAAAVVAATTSDGPSAAYAVNPSANGSVTVHIERLSDAAGLERKLRGAGVPAVVDYQASGCGPTPDG